MLIIDREIDRDVQKDGDTERERPIERDIVWALGAMSKLENPICKHYLHFEKTVIFTECSYLMLKRPIKPSDFNWSILSYTTFSKKQDFDVQSAQQNVS